MFSREGFALLASDGNATLLIRNKPEVATWNEIHKAQVFSYRKLPSLMEELIMRYLCLLVGFNLLPAFAVADSLLASDGNLIEITPLIHSSVQLEYQGLVVQIDPWNRLGLTGAKQADLILITDDIDHHLDVTAIAKLRKPDTVVLVPATGRNQYPQGTVIGNGESQTVRGIIVEAVAAYDIIPGEPAHPKGEANGYVVTLGGKRLFFAGVTECVPEVRALIDIDVAFIPMNIPLGRMTPEAAAECTLAIRPDIVYLYHYDQDYARRARTPDYPGAALPGGISIAESQDLFRQGLTGSGIEIRSGNFYPSLD